ncbi:MAG: GTPase [Thermoproteota archaeon]
MPTNLPAEAKSKWADVSAARDPKRKLRLLKEFYSLIPKHKGTSKLRVQVKKRMASLRREIKEKKSRKVGKGGPRYFVQKEGAAQVAVIGFTNVGKSSLLKAITNAKVEPSAYPYSTTKPLPGMFAYQDLQFQLVEAPALMEGSAEGEAWGLQTLALIRNADSLILMIDLTKNPVEQLSSLVKELEKGRVFVTTPQARVEIEKKSVGTGLRIVLFGKLVDCSFKDIKQLLRSYRITDAVVKIHGEATLDEVEESIFESTVHKPAIIMANKSDLAQSETNLKSLQEVVDEDLPILSVSCKTKQDLERLGESLIKTLDIIRIYTKEPNKREGSKRPFILKRGGTVSDLAKKVHSDLTREFSFAKIWADRLAFSPQKVGSTFTLEDGDLVEIHTR